MQNRMNIAVRKITDAAMFTALGTLLLFVLKFCNLGIALFFTLASLIAIYGYKNGNRYAVLPLLAISLISFLVLTPWDALCYCLPPLLSGYFYSLLLKSGKKRWIRLLFVFLAALLADILGAVVSAKIYGIDLFQEYIDLSEKIKNWLQIGEQVKLSNIITGILVGLIPSVFIITAVLNSLLTELFTEEILARVKLRQRSKNPLDLKSNKIWPCVFYGDFLAGIILIFLPLKESMLFFVLFSIVITLCIILAFYMGWQTLIVAAIYSNLRANKFYYFSAAIVLIFLLPISALTGSFFVLFEVDRKLIDKYSKIEKGLNSPS